MRNIKKSEFKLTKIALAVSAALCFVQPALAVPPNGQLPSGFNNIVGNVDKPVKDGNVMDILQHSQTAVNKWEDFSIGADATVNFKYDGKQGNFNSVNFVNSGKVSEIYGQINAHNGNIVIANSAGVQIGSSAQINVGSIYVTNKKLDDEFVKANIKPDSAIADIKKTIGKAQNSAAELMSMGGIVSAREVTFDGDRVVIDQDHLYANTDGKALAKENLIVRTTDASNVVIGYTDEKYDKDAKKYSNERHSVNIEVVKNDGTIQKENIDGYKWVENLEQLQAVNNSDKSDNYALRNSIDANYSVDMDGGKGFTSIGSSADNAFTGKFDGLGFDIFDLNIKRGDTDNIGLFGYVDGANGATIRNFTLNSGSIEGKNNTGSAVGYATNNAVIANIINTTDVVGADNSGGIIGYAENSILSGLINTGTTYANQGSQNLGGIAGFLKNSTLKGETYNLGAVIGSSSFNVGGIVGGAEQTAIGSDEFQIYNQLNVTGFYNVGGIAGKISNSSNIKNAANFGTVLAQGSISEDYYYHSANTKSPNYDNGLAHVSVEVANAGGIVGYAENSNILNIENSGDVLTSSTNGGTTVGTYYHAGNVGGIVGKAVSSYIETATNKENDVKGAHNVGGIAGYITGNSTINIGINNGGDITATGARIAGNAGFAQELIRKSNEDPNNKDEAFNIGNIGGIVGYMYGDGTFVKGSANRGTVHSEYITTSTVPETAKAANVGGIAGKIDRDKTLTSDVIKEDESLAAISDSYNAGSVQGYTGVGGIAGLMYNGEVAGSYNIGTIISTRKSDIGGSIDPLNMGGIVGDTTEETDAKVFIYDVYNSGAIGDKDFKYFGRHVGGIVGRLSGAVEKAYNTGNIYNGYNVVGGIVGYWYKGEIKNTFNTGNITVYNLNDAQSQIGGIVGAANLTEDMTLSYSYNLGTLRSFKANSTSGDNVLGGIVGLITNWDKTGHTLSIDNVYTLGNLYVKGDRRSAGTIVGDETSDVTNYGRYNIANAFYILPGTDDFGAPLMQEGTVSNGVKAVAFEKRYDEDSYDAYLEGLTRYEGFNFSNQVNNSVEGGDDTWRIYDGETLPILNAFLPDTEKFFGRGDADLTNVYKIQYGTALNPLVTIIQAKDDLSYAWSDLRISGAGSIAVYGGGLTITDFSTSNVGDYYGGTIYADGALILQGNSNSVFNFGAGSNLYGSSVTIDTNAEGEEVTGGNVSLNGKVTATNGDISISGNDIEILGTLTSLEQGESVTIDGISNNVSGLVNYDNVDDVSADILRIEDAYAHTVISHAQKADITITAEGTADVLHGHLQTGSVNLGKNSSLSVQGKDGVYVDSDLSSVKGAIALTSSNGEALLDITNSISSNLDFLKNHDDTGSSITLNSGIGDNKIAIDMANSDQTSFDLNKYDDGIDTLSTLLDNLNIKDGNNSELTARDIAYIWVNNAYQLNAIQKYSEDYTDSQILSYNFVLKNNIDASVLSEGTYNPMGGDEGYKGTFDGRDYRIIGLSVGSDNATGTLSSAGIFGTIASDGVVRNLRVYGSEFYGLDDAGTVAGINNGLISGVTTLGNHVEVFGSTNSMSVKNAHVGVAGGIAGLNNGTIKNISASDSVVAGDNGISDNVLTTAGGIVGINAENAIIGGESGEDHVLSDSAVTANGTSTLSLGGIAGLNLGNMHLITSTGVTHAEYGGIVTSDNVGGVVGINSGNIVSAFNSSDVTGGNNTGGIVGDNSGTIENAINAGDIFADYKKEGDSNYQNSGGLAGKNSGSITSGRNTGEIYGGDYVGGMVGTNESDSTLTDLSNSVFAYIYGNKYVGGIAGSNAGSISATDSNLVNYGQIYGQTYVGGIAGENIGTIKNTVSSISLHVKDTEKEASYFGGVVGKNSGTIIGATNQSDIEISAYDSSYVGGIIGHNTETGKLVGTIRNEGSVSGKSNVGGIIGQNDNDIVLQGAEDSRLTVENLGGVSAAEGGAAGIFYENKGSILYADIINSGSVTGGNSSNGVTGGLFGVNKAEIKYSTLTNNGEVSGGGTVGGLIGKNSGDILYSSLINGAEAQVSGTTNVGGLIGINSGNITGGRLDENKKDAGYYKYRIYNNGTVKGSENVGGLIGNNETGAKLLAAYNTGTVGGTNSVGGIVGCNAGTVDQVFNTVILEKEGSSSISGESNVGGIIGTNNSGTLSNAYNTSKVEGDTAVGQIVGSNKGDVSYTYATESGELIGEGTDATYSYKNMGDKYSKGDYSEFNFDSTWKIYEGSGTPLLKVFLTKLSVNDSANIDGKEVSLSDYLHLVYNGADQDIDIRDLIEKGFISGPEGLSQDDLLAAYQSTLKGGDNGDSYLLYNTDGQKKAGVYTNYLASAQIHASTGDDFNPNNLGYDIDLSQLSISKKQISLGDILATIVYGDQDGKGLVISSEASLAEGSIVGGDDVTLVGNAQYVEGGKYAENKGNRITADVGVYEDSLSVSGLSLSGADADNYEIDESSFVGNIEVTKADLVISIDNSQTVIGFIPDKESFNGTDIENELVNGDKLNFDYSYGIAEDDSVFEEESPDGGYEIGVVADGHFYNNGEELGAAFDDLFKNYTVTVMPGVLTVTEKSADVEVDPSNPNGYLYQEGWGWKRNFRERKAEVHFEDGGIKTPQSL